MTDQPVLVDITIKDLKDQCVINDYSTDCDWCLSVSPDILSRWNRIQDEYNEMQKEIFGLINQIRVD